MWTATTIDDARRARRSLSGSVALVPTMGALHRGHVSLIEAGQRLADHVLVSIFVNPTQFGPGEDLARYPRPLERDLAMCAQARVAGVFNPGDVEMYPPRQIASQLTVPALADLLEGAHRPGHFAGVCRVVAKLFGILQPDLACFGQKDYQQLRVIEAMTADLNLPVRVVSSPTVREDDGLALSSRNVYLEGPSRRHALGLYKALLEAKALVEEHDESDPRVVESAMGQVLAAHHLEVDYAVLRHPQTLGALDSIDPTLTHGVAALIAARVGGVRLIDNMVLGGAAE